MLTLNMRDSARGQEDASIAPASIGRGSRRGSTGKLSSRSRSENERKKKQLSRPKPKAAIAVRMAQDVQVTKTEIEFHLASGKGKAAVDAIAKQLAAAGWKAEDPLGNAMAGQLSFKEDEQRLTILYVDPGFIPA